MSSKQTHSAYQEKDSKMPRYEVFLVRNDLEIYMGAYIFTTGFITKIPNLFNS